MCIRSSNAEPLVYNYGMEIERPWTALWIYLGIGFVLYLYGIRDGTLLLVAMLVGYLAYQLLRRGR